MGGVVPQKSIIFPSLLLRRQKTHSTQPTQEPRGEDMPAARYYRATQARGANKQDNSLDLLALSSNEIPTDQIIIKITAAQVQIERP
jgi:hypothetical protein